MSGSQVVETKFGKITTHEDGSVTVDHEVGRFTIDAQGNVGEMDLKITVKKVAIANLFTLRSHAVSRTDRGTEHRIEFLDGGTATVVHNDAGELVHVSGDGIGQTLSRDGTMTLYSKSEADDLTG